MTTMDCSFRIGHYDMLRERREKYLERCRPVYPLPGPSLRKVHVFTEEQFREVIARAELRGAQRREMELKCLPPSAMPGEVRPQIVEILKVVCAVTQYEKAEFLGRRRSLRIAHARKVAYHLLRTLRRDLSYPAIARAMNKTDHTTIIRGLARFKEISGQEPISQWMADERIQALLK